MRLRVLSYNIHKCVGGVDRRYAPERIAGVIAHHQPDIVLLQEVARASSRFRDDDQIEVLGDLLGYRHRAYAVNVRKRGNGGEYGNGILSRFPLYAVENVMVTIPPKKARSVLHARCRIRTSQGRTRSLHLFNMHLGLSGIERKLQLKKFLASHPFARLNPHTPIVVGGDLNDLWGTLGRYLEPSDFVGHKPSLRTFPAIVPMRALDAIYVRGDLLLEQVARSRFELARIASDHLPLIADLELKHKRKRS
ncbi:MAG: endonuclease/exonuclease/phosphatase family metal-dependent hydrolase [Planctomycetota bacterium]|jgi:endonuclease/exonuclease/phosphatase family metal-dependent hydrolase